MQLIFILLLTCTNLLAMPTHEAIWDTKHKVWLNLRDIKPSPDDIFVFGEEHAFPENQNEPEIKIQHDNQVRWLNQIKRFGSISVGMEFLAYPHQEVTDGYLAGEINEADFLKQVGWGTSPFAFYREQILASRGGGKTWALNAPRSLTKKVGGFGPGGLSEQEKSLLPPIWELGSAPYFERFKEAMGEHVPAEKLENYFWAHCLWDDTMAWKATTLANAQPLTIIVGNFHSEFGHGLPERLKRYGAKKVTTVMQIAVKEWNEDEVQRALQPDPKYGHRADFLWLYSLSDDASLDSHSAR